ncbi:MAG: hypothetical protein ACFFCX_18130, partial [Candidatus Sifarchaeia archaeon]
YNSTEAGTNYGNYVDNGIIITCSSMTNGTWTLSCIAPNYVNAVSLFHSVSKSELSKVSISESIEVNSSIIDNSSNIVDTGTTNLTIWRGSSTIWAPTNQSVNSLGTTTYLWDIDTTTAENGIYTAEVFWTNGSEAGYFTKSIIVYFPTSMGTAASHIDAYTEDSFAISVYFQDTFTPQGLGSSYVSVEYSFDGGVNTSMTDHGNGTWTATVSTLGKAPGSYGIEVYGEGFAIENQTVSITVDLLHETKPLSISWSNGNNITYVESTQLEVTFQRVNGLNVSNAVVNVTIGTDTWQLTWDSTNQFYKLVFNGTDAPPGFGTHLLAILADSPGYLAQSDSSKTIILREEPTSLVLSWTNGNNITYVESTTLRVSYQMSNGTAISGATVNVTIGINTWPLTWNNGLGTYDVTFKGSDTPPGLGMHYLTLIASKAGYQSKTHTTENITLREEPTTLVIDWSSGSTISYISSTILSISFRMSNGTSISGAIGNVSIGSTTWDLVWYPQSQTYNHTFDGTADPPGLGTHSLSIVIDKFGFISKTNTSEILTIQEESTSLVISWIESNSITYVESTILQVQYRKSDLGAVTNAEVNITINGSTWNLIWHAASQSYRLTLNGTDSLLGFGEHLLLVLADRFGFAYQSNNTETLTIQLEPTNMTVSLTPDNDVKYTEFSTLIAVFAMSNGSPVASAVVNVTIGTDVWTLLWNGATEDYRIRINGTDDPPGFGLHSLVVRADRFGYVGQTNSSLTVTLREEPTMLSFQWSNTNNVSYVDSTVLQVTYTMTNGTPISSATVNVTISGETWPLTWNGSSGFFEVQFEGSDNPPGIGTYSMTVVANFFGYVSQSNSSETLILREEFTSLQINWSSGSTISFVESTV